MYPIDPRAAVQRTTTSTARAAQGSGARFTLEGSRPEAARMGGVAGAMPMDGLLALQANEDATERKRRQVKRGHDLLDGLDKLKAALLSGAVPTRQLMLLKAQLESRREATDDPGLEELIGHVELRVAVELAKLAR